MTKKQISGEPTRPWRTIDDFKHSVATGPERPALRIAGVSQSYADLDGRAQSIAVAINGAATPDEAPVAAIYADRGPDTYASVLASLMLGYTYVPLNPKFPAARNRLILDKSRASVVLCSRGAEAFVREILAAESIAPAPRLLLCDDAASDRLTDVPLRSDNEYVYTLFTSGSTGQPKGVSIRHSNLGAYLDAVWQVTDYSSEDRLSQNFDLTFDLSAHDMFVCWRAGAELVVPSAEDLEWPATFIAASGITCWFSVPSLAQKIKMQHQVTREKLGGLRLSLFCGEALRIDLAQDWATATGQRVENWYGPTEATIACTRYVVPPAPGTVDGLFGLTPIGVALPGMETLVLNGSGNEAKPGERGELLVSGPQVADGYLNDLEKTNKAFVTPAGFAKRYYRTGDSVSVAEDGQIQFIGRIDNQIKIRGYRVELGEIENVLSSLVDGHMAVVLALPLGSATPTLLVGAVENWNGDLAGLKTRMAKQLPEYMIPTRIRMVKSFPKNASGKVDRNSIGENGFKKLKLAMEDAAAADSLKSKNTGASKSDETDTSKPNGKNDVPVSIVSLVRAINPSITRLEITRADNLMTAGLDSMGFVELTMRIEQAYGVTLDQTLVAQMSNMSMNQMRVFLRKAQEKGNSGPKPGQVGQSSKSGKNPHQREMRTIDFLDKFSGFLDGATEPLVLCLGSSGFMRGISAAVIEKNALKFGKKVRAANLGMGKLSALGITELCEFVRDEMKARNRRISHAVIELEPMQLSILPPSDDTEVVLHYRQGAYDHVPRVQSRPDSRWDVGAGGTVAEKDAPQRPTLAADWEKKRDSEVRDTFAGRVKFVDSEVGVWLRGVAALREVSDSVLVVLHPIMGDDIVALRTLDAKSHFSRLIERVSCETACEMMLDTEFDLNFDDFGNISHMNSHRGREKFSQQISARLFAPT